MPKQTEQAMFHAMDLADMARVWGTSQELHGSLDDHANLPIGQRALIGDGHSAALVRLDGAIDWLCWPRFDSPAVFAQILDRKLGGVAAITPVARPFSSIQRYDGETCVLETIFRVPGQGIVRITDYMPWTGDPRAGTFEIHRRAECLDGKVELELIFDPRFNFGAHLPEFLPSDQGVLAIGPDGERLACAVEATPFYPRPEGGLRGRWLLGRGQKAWLILSWNARRVEPIAAYRPYELLRQTRSAWRAWASQLTYDGPWRHLVLRSAQVLKLLQYGPTGAILAAPTTSLPEWPGGQRNWDYRFTWARDAGLSIRALNLIGYKNEAREFFHFVRDTLDGDQKFRLMTTLDGRPVPEEAVLSHLEGYQGAKPVRTGNGAHEQLQLDSAGYLLDAAWVYEHSGGSLTLRTWRHLQEIVESTRACWRQPDHGIWEPRGELRHNLNSRLMTWVALDRAIRLAPLFGGSHLTSAWQADAQSIREEILLKGLDPSGQSFITAYGLDAPDATLLLLPMYEFLPAQDPRILATLTRVERTLADNGFLYRYRYTDGVEGQEGAFVICGFWWAEALALAGQLDRALEVFDRQVSVANHVGLLSEEVDPGTGALLGNFPQAFSHLGLISAAARLDLALRLRDETSGQRPRLPLEPIQRPR